MISVRNGASKVERGAGAPPVERLYADDKTLVRAVRQRDYAAFEQLFSTYFNELVAFSQLLVRSQELAEDLVQEEFFRIWRAGSDWRPCGSLRAYLFATVRNASRYHLRQRRNRWRLLVQWKRNAAEAAPTPMLELDELEAAAAEAIEAMPARRRQVFTLSRHHGLTYAEIAALLGISKKTVEVHMGHALRSLRQRIDALVAETA